jgi:uncharacterized protein YkwD
MVQKQYLDHYGPNGETPYQFIHKVGIPIGNSGENIAFDFRDSSKIVPAWIASPSHEKNLSNINYNITGECYIKAVLPVCDVVKGKADCIDKKEEQTLIVQLFAQI